MDIDKLFEFEECKNGYILKKYLLRDDPSVTEVEIPSKYNGKPIVKIGLGAFMSASHLCSVNIGEGIEEIGINAFISCTGLGSIILPHSLKRIRTSAFTNCPELKDPTFHEGIEYIGTNAFSGCCSIRSVKLPDSLRSLGGSPFGGCRDLRSVVIPPKIKVIPRSCFCNCIKLENIEIPEGIKEIKKYAFYGCGFRSVKFPSGLKKIGCGAFHYCLKLEKADFGGSSPQLDKDVFGHCYELSAENVIQSLARSADITKPFPEKTRFEWRSVLREDIFALALKYNSFSLYDNSMVWREIVKLDLTGLLLMAESAGWEISEKCMGELLDISMKNSFTETTAWLLDYKNRKIGFGKA
ncbi:MAG: leucine-rich repeat domain-containing protein [Ruminococcaceae bacterium]|nr:leucine-rich repeat domain-containing protein [Oscillospiraceae bacterium]